jgi:hypothetical protein
MTVTDINRSNSLTDLAHRINTEHEACGSALQRGLQHAIACGQMLIEAKDHLAQHGGWLPWLQANCTVSVKMAQNYMRVARGFGKLGDDPEANAQRVSHFSLRGALEFLAEEAWPKGIRHEQVLLRRASFSMEAPKALLPSYMGKRQMRVARHAENRQLMLVIGPEISHAEAVKRYEAARVAPSVKLIEEDRDNLREQIEELEGQIKKLREQVKIADGAILEEVQNLVGPQKAYTETYDFQCDEETWERIQPDNLCMAIR